MDTKTRQKEREITTEFARMQDELRAIIRQEFPVGTKVKWIVGHNWQHGIVEECAVYEWSTDLRVRNSRTGTVGSKHAKEFELDTP